MFNNVLWNTDELLQKCKNLCAAVIYGIEADGRINGQVHGSVGGNQIRWQHPEPGEVALNCDGSVTDAGMYASCGGVLRGDSGQFIVGFSMKLGSCSILTVELWGILHGLRLAWSRGFRHIVVYTDSKTTVSLLTDGCCRTHFYYSLVEAIHSVHDGSGSILWKYVPRESNQVAKFGLSLDNQMKIFDIAPSFIMNAPRAYFSCISFPRGF